MYSSGSFGLGAEVDDLRRDADLRKQLDGLHRRVPPGLVDVVGEVDGFDESGHRPHLIGGDGRALRGDGVVEPRLLERDGVHRPLADDQAARLRALGEVHPEDDLAFLECGRVGGVDVLPLVVFVQPRPAKATTSPLRSKIGKITRLRNTS